MSHSSTGTFRTQNIPWQARLQGVPLAGFKPRALAFAIDLALVGLLLVAAGAWLTPPPAAGQARWTLSFEFGGLLGFAVFVAYFALATFLGKGATIGKRLMGITVVSIVHEHLSLWHCVERALGYAASSLEAGFGFLQFHMHPNRQTVHDRIAETIVIRRAAKGSRPVAHAAEPRL